MGIKNRLNKSNSCFKVLLFNFHPAPPEYPGSGCVNFVLDV